MTSFWKPLKKLSIINDFLKETDECDLNVIWISKLNIKTCIDVFLIGGDF